jgi:predicted nuclease of predicted toxin-antitoxin system
VKIKLDENLPAELLDDLRAAGCDTTTVEEEGLTGTPDELLLDQVRREGRAIFTMDKGIADVRAYPPERYPGIVLFRPASAGRGAVRSFVRANLAAILDQSISGRLLVVSERGIRTR